MDIDWVTQLADQLDWHWGAQLRPRLEGLTDEEYFWEPVANCWNVRPRGESTAPISAGSGDFTMDFAWPQPDPPPVTTIAWRLAHTIVGCLGMRTASHFGGPAMAYDTFPYAGTAKGALDQLDDAYARWMTGGRGPDAAGRARPAGPREVPFGEGPLAPL